MEQSDVTRCLNARSMLLQTNGIPGLRPGQESLFCQYNNIRIMTKI
jgi:hypothetical protein